LPTSATEPPRTSPGRAVVAAAAAVALLVAAVCVAAGLGAGNALQTTELAQEAQKPMSVEALEKNVASLTRLLSKASSRAERDDLAEQQAKSKLDSEKAALSSSLSKAAKKGAASKTKAAVKEEGVLEKAFEKATAKATSAQQSSHKLKLKLNKQVEALATAQIHQHDAPKKGEGRVFDAGMDPVDHAADPEMTAKAGGGGPLGIAEPKAKMTEGTSELLALHHKLAALTSTLDQMKQAEDKLKHFANVGASLLQLPKVQAAIKQSLSDKNVKIAQEIASSLNTTWTGGDEVPPEVIASVAIATDEANSEDGVPPLNFTAPEIGDDVAKVLAQAEAEIEIEKKNSK